MTPVRHFLDWNEPLTHLVRVFLIPEPPVSCVDLSDTWVVVPTRQAGRRLREKLASFCGEHGTALIPPVVEEPMGLLRTLDRVAGPLITQSVWARVLMDMQPEAYPDLFPKPPPVRDFSWAQRTADMIQRVRNILVEGGCLIRDVYDKHASSLPEAGRWHDLSQLEEIYLQRVHQTGLRDRCQALIEQGQTPVLSPSITRIILASVPDPSPLILHALETLAQRHSVEILVHAPASLAAHFDDWGHPVKEAWTKGVMDIPDPSQNILTATTPSEQAARVVELIREEQERFGPLDVAIGVPDPEVCEYMATQLSQLDLMAFNPSGHPFRTHRLFQLLTRIHDLLAYPSYAHIAAFLRHPDTLLALTSQRNISPDLLLSEMDRLQNKHLPQNLSDLERVSKSVESNHPLHAALELIREILAAANLGSLDQMIQHIMPLLYAHQTVDPQTRDGESFVAVAKKVVRLLEETQQACFNDLHLKNHESLQLLLKAMDKESWYEDSQHSQVDLEGWLELPWNDAPFLIVTGLNEGLVPDGRMSDVFLPDTLLAALGLRSDGDRMARDAYLMTALIASRVEKGRACFIVGKFSRTGDPLLPSRLLFRCEDHELPERANRLFQMPPTRARLFPAKAGFQLDPARALRRNINRLGVTAFRQYLACPFRFYLAQVARMQELADHEQEMDALTFGHIMHYALQGLEDQPRMQDESELIAMFLSRAEQRVLEQYGAHPPLPVVMQMESIRQRLIATAHIQSTVIADGWVPTHFEQPVSCTIGTITLRGVIDRVDYHPDLKSWRILDYKTTDKCTSPSDAHWAGVREDTPEYAVAPAAGLRGKNARWVDLQLPIYHQLFRMQHPGALVKTAYFNLPVGVMDTQVSEWNTLTDDLVQSAWHCAEAIVDRIEQGIFWPPADTIPYDDFESLFPFAADQCFAPLAPSKEST